MSFVKNLLETHYRSRPGLHNFPCDARLREQVEEGNIIQTSLRTKQEPYCSLQKDVKMFKTESPGGLELHFFLLSLQLQCGNTVLVSTKQEVKTAKDAKPIKLSSEKEVAKK